MIDNDSGKRNLLISYLFDSEDIIGNIDSEFSMISDLQELAEKWKAKGYIKRYVIADDEGISDALKSSQRLTKRESSF